MNTYDHLSYSSISRFIACPAQFEFYHKLSKKVLPSEAAHSGNVRHRDIANHLVDGTLGESKFGERMKSFCRHILKTPTAVESEFRLDFITNIVQGKIDAYTVKDNQAVIVDWKNFPGFYNELQLKIYALAIRERHPEVEVVHGYFFFTGSDYYEVHTYFTDEIHEFSNDLSQIIDRISCEEKFEPIPGPHCNRCDYVDHCPIATRFEITKVETMETVFEMAKRIYAAEASVDKAKERIKAFMLAKGIDNLPIDDENRYYLNTSIALRTGKIKNSKEKKASSGIIDLVSSGPTKQLSSETRETKIITNEIQKFV